MVQQPKVLSPFEGCCHTTSWDSYKQNVKTHELSGTGRWCDLLKRRDSKGQWLDRVDVSFVVVADDPGHGNFTNFYQLIWILFKSFRLNKLILFVTNNQAYLHWGLNQWNHTFTERVRQTFPCGEKAIPCLESPELVSNYRSERRSN